LPQAVLSSKIHNRTGNRQINVIKYGTIYTIYSRPLVITLQDWSVNYVRKLKCQPSMEAAQLVIEIRDNSNVLFIICASLAA
jgi:hypothetical protein